MHSRIYNIIKLSIKFYTLQAVWSLYWMEKRSITRLYLIKNTEDRAVFDWCSLIFVTSTLSLYWTIINSSLLKLKFLSTRLFISFHILFTSSSTKTLIWQYYNYFAYQPNVDIVPVIKEFLSSHFPKLGSFKNASTVSLLFAQSVRKVVIWVKHLIVSFNFQQSL